MSAVSQGDLGETEREIGKLARRMQGDIEIHDAKNCSIKAPAIRRNFLCLNGDSDLSSKYSK